MNIKPKNAVHSLMLGIAFGFSVISVVTLGFTGHKIGKLIEANNALVKKVDRQEKIIQLLADNNNYIIDKFAKLEDKK